MTKINVRDLAHEIGEHLDGDWDLNDRGVSKDRYLADSDSVYLTRLDGKVSLFVRVPYGSSLVTVEGDYYSHQGIQIERDRKDRVKANPGRGGAAIAGDITRKILDNVVENHAHILDKIHDHALAEHVVYGAKVRFKNIIPELAIGRFADTHYSRHASTQYDDPIRVDIELDFTDEKVRELSFKDLDTDEVSELLRTLQDIRTWKASRAS